MNEQTITLSLSDVAYSFDCVAGLHYRLKEPVEIDGKKWLYAMPHFTMPKCWLVDCTLFDEDFETFETYTEIINPEEFDEPILERYLN